MELQTTIYLVVGLSFALYIGIAIWARAGSTSEFYAAGGQVNPVMNGMATAADWMSAASFISMAGLISNMGYGGGLFLMGWTGGYVLLAMLLAPYLRKFGKFTVPQFIGDRFYSKSASTVAVICLLTASITYIIGQMTGVGVAFSRFLGVSSEVGIYVGMGIVFLYAVFGGMKGITYTQVAQYIVLIVAYTIPAVFIGYTNGMALTQWQTEHAGSAELVISTMAHQVGNVPDVLDAGSSRGPGVGYTLKPDIAAPGVNILAEGYADAEGEDRHLGLGQASGTSMAAPHVAGAAALLKQAHPGWSPADVKSALMSTAKFIGVYIDRARTTPAQPLEMGAGRLDLSRAADPGVLLDPAVGMVDGRILPPARGPGGGPGVDRRCAHQPGRR